MSVPDDDERLRRRPKVLLHDHFDGGIRAATIIDLANDIGYRDLPTYDVDDLAAWYVQCVLRLRR